MTNHLIPDASERAAFEAWARENRYSLDRNLKDDAIAQAGSYISIPTFHAWEVWQARAAAQVGAKGAEYRTCCDHPDCPTCAGRGGFHRLAAGAPAKTPKPVALTEQQVADRLCGGLIVDAAHRALVNGDSVKVTLPTLTRIANFFATPAATIGAGEGKDADGERWRFFVANAGHQCKGKTLAEWLASDGVMEYGSRDAAIDAVRNAGAAMRSKTSPGEAG